MLSFWNITIGEIITFSIALLALFFASRIGIKQNAINETLLKLQDYVELYILVEPLKKIDINDESKVSNEPAMMLRNLSSAVIYIDRYVFNGREYQAHDRILPPISHYPGCYHITLPSDGTSHVSFEIYFEDWKHKKWLTKGYADFSERQWKITYAPCQIINRD